MTGYVAQSTSAGAITYVESSYARNALLPMAKLLNAAGYYTAPSAGAVAVALTAAQLDPSLIVHVDNVYTNPDPRSYPLSAISYLIIPTSTAAPFTTAKGISLGAFAQYALCQGQRDAAALGYSPLAPNLVQAGLNEIPHIPGAQVPTIDPAVCANPSATLIANLPQPQSCDQVGSPVCPDAPSVGALAVSPGGSAPQGAPITLTATFSPVVPGTVQFDVLSGAVVTTLATVPAIGGSATVTVSTLPVGTYSFFTTFIPADPASGIRVTTTSLPYTVTTPTTGPPGALVIAVTTNPQVTLPSPILDPSGALLRTSGALSPLTVTDNRAGSPGWTVSGQVGDFADGAGDTIAAQNLGWSPTVIDAAAAQVITAGPLITPAAETTSTGPDAGGLGIARTLATGSGLGTTHLGATLHLDVPTSTRPGTYIATLTLTAI